VSSREMTTFEVTCDRCGYTDHTDSNRKLDPRWERRRGLDFCPGCTVDFYRFLANEPVQRMCLGDDYRAPDADERRLLADRLAQKGVGW
jgi:hypothetical protein